MSAVNNNSSVQNFKMGVFYSLVAVSSALCCAEVFRSRRCQLAPIPHCSAGLQANVAFLGGLPGLCLASASAAFVCFQKVIRGRLQNIDLEDLG